MWRDSEGWGDVYARRVDAAGIPQGGASGTALCINEEPQRFPAIATDGAGGGIICWEDSRNSPEYGSDIYAARFYASGSTDVAPSTPEITSLAQNQPNPFNPNTAISFSLAREGFVELVVYSCDGRRVATLVRELRPAGPHRETWDGRHRSGYRMPSGIYFYRLDVAGGSQTKKMTLAR